MGIVWASASCRLLYWEILPGGGGLFVDFGNLVAHGRVGRSWPGIDFTPGFCLRPSPPVLLFSQGPQALPMLKRKAGRGAFNTMDV